MKYEYIKFNVVYFFIIYILLCGTIFFVSHKFFLDDFLLIEKEQNKNNIETFLTDINKNIESLKNDTNDYANWDDTYEFMKNKNKQYIYENFRDGVETLIEMNLGSITYINAKNKILYSQYNNNFLNSNKKDFEHYLVEEFKNIDTINTIINYNSQFIYLFKSRVKRSDKTGENVGSLFTTKILDSEYFTKNYPIFKSVQISNNNENSFDANIRLEYLNAKIITSLDYNYLTNNIQFFDKNEQYIISLITTSNRDLIKKSQKTIVIFNQIVFFVIFVFFFFLYKNQYLINNQNSLLNKRVDEKTKKLKEAYKRLREKSRELYRLANIDSLTKIKNRRSFFYESNILLNKAITNNLNLHIVIMDIDDFKKINDKFGHSIGDEVLITFCDIVNNILDRSMPFGRIGGEEFSITFYDKEDYEVSEICENIRNKCERYNLNINGEFLTFTISLGLSSKSNLSDTIDKILQRADLLLYDAKNSGKNKLTKEKQEIVT